jgi:hypothetical protein
MAKGKGAEIAGGALVLFDPFRHKYMMKMVRIICRDVSALCFDELKYSIPLSLKAMNSLLR